MEKEICGRHRTGHAPGLGRAPEPPGFYPPVDMQSFCRPLCSFRLLPFMLSGPAHATLDTVALVLFSQVINHLARQSHSKAFPRRSLQGRRGSKHSQHCWEKCWRRGKAERKEGPTHSSMSESKSEKSSLGKNLMLLLANDLKTNTRGEKVRTRSLCTRARRYNK